MYLFFRKLADASYALNDKAVLTRRQAHDYSRGWDHLDPVHPLGDLLALRGPKAALALAVRTGRTLVPCNRPCPQKKQGR